MLREGKNAYTTKCICHRPENIKSDVVYYICKLSLEKSRKPQKKVKIIKAV